MRSKQFEIPIEVMGEFFTELEEAELDARLIEVDEDGDLVMSVDYEERDRDVIMSLLEIMDDFRDQEEEND